MSYITEAELRLKPYDISKDTIEGKDLTNMQAMTKAVIDNLCKQDFDKEGTSVAYVEKRMDGRGKDTIFLPKRLVTLEKIRIYSSTLNYVDYDADNFTAKTKFISWNVFATGTISARLNVEAFPKGTYNIGVFGIWGWETPPEPIKYLQGRLIGKILEDGSYANGYKSEKIGDFSYTMPDTSNFSMSLGDKELDLIVRQYKDLITYVVP